MEKIITKAKKDLGYMMSLPLSKASLLVAYEKGYKRAMRDMNDAHKQTPIEFEDWSLDASHG